MTTPLCYTTYPGVLYNRCYATPCCEGVLYGIQGVLHNMTQVLYNTCYITPCYKGVLCIIIKVLYNTLLYNRCYEGVLHNIPCIEHFPMII
jgi:hypothetical protein